MVHERKEKKKVNIEKVGSTGSYFSPGARTPRPLPGYKNAEKTQKRINFKLLLATLALDKSPGNKI